MKRKAESKEYSQRKRITTDESAFFQVLGNRDLLRLITSFQRGRKWEHWDDGDSAAMNGHLSLLKEKARLGERMFFSKMAMDLAASRGHLEVLDWLYENRREGCNQTAMDMAAENGHLDAVKWLHRHGESCTKQAMTAAAINGHIDIVQWLYYNRPEQCRDTTVISAVKNGKLRVAEWLVEKEIGYTRLREVIKTAYHFGHEQFARWVYEEKFKSLWDFPWSELNKAQFMAK